MIPAWITARVTHMPWCMLGSLTHGGVENVRNVRNLHFFCIWQEAHEPWAKEMMKCVCFWEAFRSFVRKVPQKNHFEIWQVSRQQCCRGSCQILEWYKRFNCDKMFHPPLTLSQSPCTALTAGICLLLGLCKGTVTGVWKTVGIPTGYVSP